MFDDTDFWDSSGNANLLKKLFGNQGHSGQVPMSGGLNQSQKPASSADFSKLSQYQPPESPLQLAQGISAAAKATVPQINPVAPPNRIKSVPIGGLAVGSQQPSTLASNNLPQILQALRR